MTSLISFESRPLFSSIDLSQILTTSSVLACPSAHHLFVRRAFPGFLALLTLSTTGTAASTASIMSTKTSSIPSTTTFAGPATHTIQVGPKTNPHAYVPHNITASVGDTVVFEFYPTNHSVVKADYLAPCVPASDGLFYSGSFSTFNEHDGQLVGPVSGHYSYQTRPT